MFERSPRLDGGRKKPRKAQTPGYEGELSLGAALSTTHPPREETVR